MPWQYFRAVTRSSNSSANRCPASLSLSPRLRRWLSRPRAASRTSSTGTDHNVRRSSTSLMQRGSEYQTAHTHCSSFLSLVQSFAPRRRQTRTDIRHSSNPFPSPIPNDRLHPTEAPLVAQAVTTARERHIRCLLWRLARQPSLGLRLPDHGGGPRLKDMLRGPGCTAGDARGCRPFRNCTPSQRRVRRSVSSVVHCGNILGRLGLFPSVAAQLFMLTESVRSSCCLPPEAFVKTLSWSFRQWG
ncbi:hypothetical protein GE09DRAFT_345597 [Coniochaeta sp. 2T2.1]|nr:hypothetical protein GE09DRAFT_345597 [Coniochaeta sp. 2T2.1]